MNMPNLDEKYQLYIGGEWRDASDGGTFTAACPADGRELAQCAAATEKDVDDAVQAAWKAWECWKKTSPAERAKALNKIADLIEEFDDHLAMIETLDNGKPIRESLGADIPAAAEHFRYFAGAILTGEGRAAMMDEQTMSIILREPIGVAGQIIPWNFPLLMASWKLAPVIAAGCCTVIKPAMETSLSLSEMVKLFQGIIPDGVVNVVTGSGSGTGSFILNHPGFAKFAFTGSTEVGYTVAKAAAEKLIPATLELGGKSANIFYDDCDWKLAMDGLQQGILFNQGQVCSAGSRIFVQEGIYDKFIDEAVRCFQDIRVGMPWEEATQMGAIISEKQMNQILEYIDIGRKEGASVACGGRRLTEDGMDKGFFIAPTILADVQNTMRVAREEIFGPVAAVIKFKTEDDVIAMANDSDYGLAGGVFSTNIGRALRTARGVRTGRMWVNTYNSIPAGTPFGGYKKSGIGRETHKMLLGAYTQVKNIVISLSDEPSGLY